MSMMRQLVDSALKVPLLVAALVLGLFSFGFVQLKDMPVDVLPDFTPTRVEVQTESLGLSAVEVEQLITAPMEQLLLNGVPWLEDISSESIPGLSSIVLVFEPGTDPLEARQVVQERLSQGRDLPKVAKAPVMLQPLSSLSRVMMVRVDSEKLTPIQQSVLAKWTVKPALMGVPGVANVAIWGQREQQMQVQVDPKLLAERGVSLTQVVRTSANSLWVSPLSFVEASTPGTGGFIDTPNQRLGIQHILPITKPEDLASVTLEGPDRKPVIGKDGKPVLLGDVVTVVEDHQPLIGDAVAGEGQGLMLVVEKFPEANTLDVTRGIQDTLDQLSPGLTGVTFDTEVFRPASYLDMALENLGWVALLGLVLMLLVLALLHGWRLALVAAVVVPLALVAAALVLHLRDATMNLMLLAGLVVAAVAIVDDAVVDFDNFRRRLREAEQGADGRRTIASSVLEMRRPVVFATLIMLAATIPAFYVASGHGLDADFFTPVVVSYALALLASTVVALVVTPVLSLALLRNDTSRRADSPVARRLQSSYSGVLGRTLVKPALLAAAFGVVAVAGLVAAPFLDADMRPGIKERTLLVHWETASGTSHQEMSRITALVADELRDVPGIANVGAHVGRALSSDQVSSVNSGELWVSLTPEADHDETLAAAQDVVSSYPGIEQEVLTYSQERTDVNRVGTTTPNDVVVRVFGQEYDVLAEKAGEVSDALRGIDGVEDVTVATQPQEAQIEVQVDLDAAKESGLTPGQVRRAAATLVSGIEVGSLFEQQKVFEVLVVGTPQSRHDLTVVNDLVIEAPTGGQVRLGDVADVRIEPVPTVVRHGSVSRYVDVTASVSGRSVGDVGADAEEALAALEFPLEYHGEVLGDYTADQSARMQLLGFSLAALVVIYLLFQAFLRSWGLATLALVGVPLALSGGALAAAATGTSLGLGALLGGLVVLGVYARNLLTLFGRLAALAPRDGRPGIGVVVHGAQERFLATLATPVAVALMLLPVLVLGRVPGLEVLQPMAVVVLGGLVTTTVLSLFLLPLAYLHTAPEQGPPELDDRQDQPTATKVPAGAAS
jgi:Cu/Ag efflux pump CusA